MPEVMNRSESPQTPSAGESRPAPSAAAAEGGRARRKPTLQDQLRDQAIGRLVQGLIAFANALPVEVASATGARVLPRLVAGGPIHKMVADNVRMALPEKSDAEIEQILRAMWENFGRSIAEFPHTMRLVESGRVEIVGAELLHRAKDGALLLGCHMGAWELIPAVARSLGHPLDVVIAPERNELISQCMINVRAPWTGGQFIVGQGAMGKMRESFAAKMFVGLGYDRHVPSGRLATYFGRKVRVAAEPIEVALELGVSIMLVHCERGSGTRSRVTFGPELPPDPGLSLAENVESVIARFHEVVEGWVRNNPSQVYWLHRRFRE